MTTRPAIREVPVPTSVSAEAQGLIAMGALSPVVNFPALDDIEGWRTVIAEADERISTMFVKAADLPVDVTEIDADGARVFVATPRGIDPSDNRVYLEVHGGALTQMGGALCKRFATLTAHKVGTTVWAVDYRMPPDHPYPVPLDDCVAAYRALLARASPRSGDRRWRVRRWQPGRSDVIAGPRRGAGDARRGGTQHPGNRPHRVR